MKPIRYIWSELKYTVRRRWNPVHWVPATILCLRFPFLYPRNRFSGRHYTNWKIRDRMYEAQRKTYDFVGEIGNKENPYHRVVASRKWLVIMKFYDYLELFLGVFHMIPYYTELIGMDAGWRKAFGIQMCKEIKRALLDAGGRKMLHAYRITDIKEKYGSLRWYDTGAPEEVEKIIAKYEYISQRTCIVCGKPADYVTRGWVEPYCKDHLPEKIDPDDPEQVVKFYTEENPWYGAYKIKFDKKEEENVE